MGSTYPHGYNIQPVGYHTLTGYLMGIIPSYTVGGGVVYGYPVGSSQGYPSSGSPGYPGDGDVPGGSLLKVVCLVILVKTPWWWYSWDGSAPDGDGNLSFSGPPGPQGPQGTQAPQGPQGTPGRGPDDLDITLNTMA